MINKKKKIKDLIRGYYKLKGKSNHYLSYLKDDIISVDLNIDNEVLQKFFKTKLDLNFEIIVKQLLLTDLLDDFFFNKKILSYLYNKKPIFFPICVQWKKIFKLHDISVNYFISNILFYFYIFKKIIKGIREIFKQLISNNHLKDNYNYISFLDLEENSSLPKKKNSYDIITWVNEIYNKNYNFDYIHIKGKEKEYKFTKKLVFNDNIIHPSLDINEKIHFLSWSLFFFIKLFLDLLRGRWATSLLSYEIVLAKKIELLNANKLAKEYFFSFSKYSFRPLWTYFAEKKNSKVSLFCYGANIPFYEIKGEHTSNYNIKYVTWNFLLWSDDFKEFIEKHCPHVGNIEKYDFIYYSDSSYDLNINKKEKYIAIFDILPLRYFKIAEMGRIFYPIDFPYIKKFIEDITDCAKLKNYKILIKHKRNISSDAHNLHYQDFLYTFQRETIKIIDSDFSANKLVSMTDFSISCPFTSAGLLGRIYNKQSIYYDPFSIICKNDRAAQGIKVLSGKKELDNFFLSK